jgi:two-component system, sensor histidine kinase PdtaS
MISSRSASDSGRPAHEPAHVLVVGAAPRLARVLARAGHEVITTPSEAALERVDDRVEAVIITVRGSDALTLCQRLKTRFQVPLLPVIILRARPHRTIGPIGPDAWLRPSTRGREVVARIEELVRIRRAERDLARLNETLVTLAAENGQLYERARLDASRTLALLRELQHRVRNNLAAIQALLVLERHRSPRRSLDEAIDVAIARIRGMAALQDAVSTDAGAITLGTLARAITRNMVDVFGPSRVPTCEVHGDAEVPAQVGSSLAVALNELVMNAVRHAEARNVRIAIEGTNGEVVVQVIDDGRGIASPESTGGGLIIARTVVRNELRGTLDVVPASSGTAVRMVIPVPRDPPMQTAR